MDLIASRREELAVESTLLVNVGGAHEGTQNNAGGGVHHEDGRHHLVAEDRAFLTDDRKALRIEIATG